MKHILGATLLIAGTSIGAGMLALPVATALGGFIPSALFFTLTWLFMCGTGLLFLELALWLGEGKNIISMAGLTLGAWGRVIAWILYIYLFYSLTVAYISGGGAIIHDITSLPIWLCTLLFVALFAPLVYLGAKTVDRTNLLLMGGLIVTYALFIALTLPYVHLSYTLHMDWSRAFPALPILITAFGFQGTVPTLTGYLRRNPRAIRIAIVVGSFLPLLAYLLWNLVFLGSIPPQALSKASLAIQPLRALLQNPWITALGNGFGFFALTSSFLGVTLGLRDFLADGLKVRKDRPGRLLICSIIYLPALAFAFLDPDLFIFFVNYGGGIGCTLILGLLPIAMVWAGRYHHRLEGTYRLCGGRPVLVMLALFAVAVLVAETW